ncbi:MAG: PAS domain S-box protein, partial [Rhodothermales bacterium]|nr:PAS domain S-box protein [Rhodothermales bacterium]
MAQPDDHTKKPDVSPVGTEQSASAHTFSRFFEQVFEHPSGNGTGDGAPSWPASLFQVVHDAVFVFPITEAGAPGAFMLANEAAGRLAGYPVEALRQKTFLDLAADPEALAQQLSALAESPHAVFEAGLRTPSGDVRTLDVRAQRLDLDDARAALAICRDVTEQRRAEAAWSHLAAIITSSSDAIIGKTLDGTITSWNAAAEHIYGYTADEAIGQHITLIVPEERWGEIQDIHARLARGERVTPFETVRVARDGRRLHISLSVSPVLDAKGHIVGAAAIARDITPRRQVQQALRRREAQQAAVARLGAAALKGAALDVLRQSAVEELAEQLGVEYAKVLELLPGGDGVRLVAGVGWKEGLVGEAVVGVTR